MNIKAVLFDLDGTLIDSLDEVLRALNKLFRIYANKEITKEHFQLTFRMPFADWYREQGIDAPTEDVLAHWRSEYRPEVAEPFPDAHDALLRLAGRGLQLGVISGSDAEVVTSHLTRHRLDSHISYVHGGDGRKVARMHAFCDELSMPYGDVVYVGDAVSDMHDAVEAGLVPIGIARNGGLVRDALSEAGATMVLASLLELLPLLGVQSSEAMIQLR